MKFLIALLILNICLANSMHLKNYSSTEASLNQDQEEQNQLEQNVTQMDQKELEQKRPQYYNRYKTMISQESKNQTIVNQTQLAENGTESSFSRKVTAEQTPIQNQSQQNLDQSAQNSFGQNMFQFGQIPFTFGQNPFQLFQIPNILSQIPNPFVQIQNQNAQLPNPNVQILNPFSQFPNLFSQIQTPNFQIPNQFAQIPTQYPIQFQPIPTQLEPIQEPVRLPLVVPIVSRIAVSTQSTCNMFPSLPICRKFIETEKLNEKKLTGNDIGNETICKYSDFESKLWCTGERTIECEIESDSKNLNKLDIIIENVRMVPVGYTFDQWNELSESERKSEIKSIDRVFLYSTDGEYVNMYTIEQNNKEVTWSFHNKTMKVNKGLKVKDSCWNNFTSLIGEVKPHLLKLSMEL